MITKEGQGSSVQKEEERQRRLNTEHTTRGRGNHMFIDDSDLVFDR